MHWLLQENLSTEQQLQPFVEALNHIQSLGASWSFVKLIPFVGDVVPDDDYSNKKVFALGSTSMIAASIKRKWNPGVIYNSNFRFEKWIEGFGAENMLNGDGVVVPFGRASVTDQAFIRPCEDLKAFTGFVVGRDELLDWQRKVADGERSSRAIQLASDTPIVVAPPKAVLREWRFFVVAGKVITGSQYRTLYGIDKNAIVDQDVWDYAQTMVDRWQPADCFVIDIGATSDRLSIIEINCFNGSGVYLCDMKKALEAVERFYNL